MNINALTAVHIRQIRESLNYTEKYVASFLNISISTYSKLERGLINFTLEKLQKLSECFNMSIFDLIPINKKGVDNNINDDKINNLTKQIVLLISNEILHVKNL